MKKTLSILFLLFSAIVICKSQDGLSIQGSVGINTQNFKSFDLFSKGYNSSNVTTLTKELEPFGVAGIKELGVAFRVSGFELCFSRSWAHSQTNAILINNNQRVFDLKRSRTGIEVGYSSIDNDRAAYIGVVIGFALGTSVLDSYYIYADGTLSRGAEQYWSGTFSSYNANPYIGIKSGIGFKELKWLKLLVKGDYMFGGFFGYDAYFRDWNDLRSATRPDQLPTDVDAYSNSVYVYDYKGDYVKNAISGFRLQIGLSIDLISDSD